MSAPKHTAGPWGVWNGTDVFTDYEGASDGAQIADCNVDLTVPDGHGLSVQEVKANARLIAAAPDLLEALLGCIPQLELGNGEAEHIKAAHAAIAKATGADQ